MQRDAVIGDENRIFFVKSSHKAPPTNFIVKKKIIAVKKFREDFFYSNEKNRGK